MRTGEFRAVFLVLACLGGCGPTAGDGTSAGALPPLARIAALLEPAPTGTMPEAFAALQAAQAPVMLASIERDNRPVALLRVMDRDGVETWRSRDNATLALRDGVLIATRGLGDDLLAADPGAAAALILAGTSGQATRIHRRLDGADQIAISAFVCNLAPRGPRSIAFDGQTFDTLLVEEDCIGPDLAFTNLYWTRGGQILQSRQWVSPGTGPVALRRVTP